MKKLIVACSLFISVNALSQLEGDVVNDNRTLLTNTDFIIEGNEDAKLVFDVAVKNTGEVSGVTFVPSESTSQKTPSQYAARQHIQTFKFEEGTHYPEFHKVRVTITLAISH